jgi:hypothetical protein
MPTQGGDDDYNSGLSTAHGRDWPGVRQFNVFVENRVGGLAFVVRHFETTDVRIVSMSIVDTADCAIIRLVLNDADRAREILEQARLMFAESDLLVVRIPDVNQPLLQICKSLLEAEVNIHYAYPMLVGPSGNAALALHVEEHEQAAKQLLSKGFVLYSDPDFEGTDYLS